MDKVNHLIPTYTRQDIAFTHGEGVWLWDESGNRYLDALAGLAVSVLGHAHPAVVAAIREQAGRVLHTSNLYRIPVQEDLSAALCERARMDRVFFSNSGAEANEAAIKLARLHGHRLGIQKPKIVVMEGAFHGRTLAALAATGNAKAQAGFEPLPEGFVRVAYGDAGAAAALAEDPNIAAVLVEPIQGEAGIRTPPADYLRQLHEICRDQGWLLMLDEVQTGVGRTGAWFAHQHEGITPDVMSLAKGLGGGVPIGATLVTGAANDLFGPGSHGSTFGGNPLASRAALAVLDTIAADDLLTRARDTGEFLRQRLNEGLGRHPAVITIRGAGLMIGIELDRPCGELVDAARERGLLINVAAGNTIRLLPPLILDAEQADQIAATLIDAVAAFVEG